MSINTPFFFATRVSIPPVTARRVDLPVTVAPVPALRFATAQNKIETEWNPDHALGLTYDEALLAEQFGSGRNIGNIEEHHKPPGWTDTKLTEIQKQLQKKFDCKDAKALLKFLDPLYTAWNALLTTEDKGKKQTLAEDIIKQLAKKALSPFGTWAQEQKIAWGRVQPEANRESFNRFHTDYWFAKRTKLEQVPEKPKEPATEEETTQLSFFV